MYSFPHEGYGNDLAKAGRVVGIRVASGPWYAHERCGDPVASWRRSVYWVPQNRPAFGWAVAMRYDGIAAACIAAQAHAGVWLRKTGGLAGALAHRPNR